MLKSTHRHLNTQLDTLDFAIEWLEENDAPPELVEKAEREWYVIEEQTPLRHGLVAVWRLAQWIPSRVFMFFLGFEAANQAFGLMAIQPNEGTFYILIMSGTLVYAVESIVWLFFNPPRREEEFIEDEEVIVDVKQATV